ncbi:MAG TPA: hypothetical protein VGA31_00195 [Thermoanaerobaculia bacterium]
MSQVSSDRRSRLSGFALPVLFLLAGSALAQVPEAIEANMKKMLTAIQSNSYDDFLAPGDAAFKSGMNKQMLDGVSTQIGPRMKQGYHATFLGKLNQQGYTVYLWKLEFNDRKDDYLVKMAVRDGKVGGFLLQ